ncbi:MAG TPA: M1 family metallopeptidase, partial [Kofleriaceae bacterium]|nr:M1 family metallopeptidase [Kofleriaceae bacterium]
SPEGAESKEADPPAPTFRLGDALKPTHVRARLRIDPDQPGFAGEVWIDATLATTSKTIWLNARGLTIDHAEIGTQAVRTELAGTDFLGLHADTPAPAGAITIHIAYHGTFETKTSAGAFVQPVANARYVFTQFESTYARRVFPSVDEPWSKVPWQLTIEAPAKQVVVSNTGIEQEDKLDAGFVAHRFAETKPLPSYLVAFAVGPFEIVDAGLTRRAQPVRIITLAGRAAEAKWAAQITPGIVDALDDFFALPYPYEKLDIVSIPQTYGFGAMENAGMITYVESGLLIDPNDPSLVRRRNCATTLAHEIAHQWFGDLVTMSWWDDIWLNEGFATWVQGKIIAKEFPEWNAELDALDQRETALDADSLASARMIRQPVASQDDIESAFDRITYEKGASVLRMFEAAVGPDTFREGVRAYLRQHAYGNATSKDFVASISDAAGHDVGPAFATFLEQVGAPMVEVDAECKKLPMHQARYLPIGAPGDTSMPHWAVPVCAISDRGRECMELDKEGGELVDPSMGCTKWVYGNAGATGYYRVELDAGELAAIVTHGWKALSIAERLTLASDVAAMVRAGKLELGPALDLATKLAGGSPREVLAAIALAKLPARFVDGKQRKAYDAWIVKTFGARARAFGWTKKKNTLADTYDQERLRQQIVPLVADAGDATLRAQAIQLAAKWRDLPNAIRGPVIWIAASDAKTFAALAAALPKETDRNRRYELLDALGGVRDPARLKSALAFALDPKLDGREVARVLAAVRLEPATQQLLADFLREHLTAIVAALPEQARARIAGTVASACDAARRDEQASLVKDQLTSSVGGPRSVAQAIERMDQCIALRAQLAPSLAKRYGGV